MNIDNGETANRLKLIRMIGRTHKTASEEEIYDRMYAILSKYDDINNVKHYIDDIDITDMPHLRRNKIISIFCRNSNNVNIIKYVMNKYTTGNNIPIDNEGQTYLHHVCVGMGNLEIIKYLVEVHNIDYTFEDVHGYDCLHYACMGNNVNVIRYLVNICEMDVNHVNRHGTTYLIVACVYNNIDVVKYLIKECNADVSRKDMFGQTCLYYVCDCDDDDNYVLVRYLVEECNMDVNTLTNDRDTYLNILCRGNNIRTIKYLIEECGADVEAINNQGMTCLHHACDNGHLGVIKYLVNEQGLDVNDRDNHGVNCLHYACGMNSIRVIDYLISDCGMSVKDVDINGKDCLQYAINNIKYKEIVDYLVTVHDVNISHDCKNVICIDGGERIIYLINKYNVDIIKTCIFLCIKDIDNIIREVYKTYDKTPDLINKYFSHQNEDYITEHVSKYKQMNPLITYKDYNRYGTDVMTGLTYDMFKNYVNQLKYSVAIDFNELPDNYIPCHEFVDYGKPSEVIFIHNDNKYYGDMKTMCRYIDILETLKNNRVLDDEPIILTGTLSRQSVNIYLNMCNTKTKDISNISKDEFMEFLMFMDRYPSKGCNIKRLERAITKYILDNEMKVNTYLKNICDRYRLFELYHTLHGLKYV